MMNKLAGNPFGTNEILKGKGFHVSYNSSPGGNIKLFQSDNGSDETALYNKKQDKFYILNGDFRDDYLKLVDKGWKACYEFYLSKKEEFRSSWSSDYLEDLLKSEVQ